MHTNFYPKGQAFIFNNKIKFLNISNVNTMLDMHYDIKLSSMLKKPLHLTMKIYFKKCDWVCVVRVSYVCMHVYSSNNWFLLSWNNVGLTVNVFESCFLPFLFDSHMAFTLLHCYVQLLLWIRFKTFNVVAHLLSACISSVL